MACHANSVFAFVFLLSFRYIIKPGRAFAQAIISPVLVPTIGLSHYYLSDWLCDYSLENSSILAKNRCFIVHLQTCWSRLFCTWVLVGHSKSRSAYKGRAWYILTHRSDHILLHLKHHEQHKCMYCPRFITLFNVSQQLLSHLTVRETNVSVLFSWRLYLWEFNC